MCDTYSSLPPNRATNMTSMEALTQVMEKSNRLEHFADSRLKTAPRDSDVVTAVVDINT